MLCFRVFLGFELRNFNVIGFNFKRWKTANTSIIPLNAKKIPQKAYDIIVFLSLERILNSLNTKTTIKLNMSSIFTTISFHK